MKTTNIEKIAYGYVFNRYNIAINHSKKIKVDRRFKTSSDILRLVNHLLEVTDFTKIKAKQKARAISKTVPNQNYLHNPIVKDWIKNKPNVHPNRLNIGNHWAKNETDFKILSVLGKTNQTI